MDNDEVTTLTTECSQSLQIDQKPVKNDLCDLPHIDGARDRRAESTIKLLEEHKGNGKVNWECLN